MSTLKSIRKRIVSVKNTQKITRAMKMVAAAKLRRAQSRLVSARPYKRELTYLITELSHEFDSYDHLAFLSPNPDAPALVIVFNSDRGLCGGFNSNLLRRVQVMLKETKNKKIQIESIGRKGRDYFKSKKIEYHERFSSIDDVLHYVSAVEQSKKLLADYAEGKFSEIIIVYNSFKSAISQEITVQKILPFPYPEEKVLALPSLYDPEASQIFDDLLPRYLATELYLASLESATSELGSRMSAMDSATNNAKEMISNLTLIYNRVRQAAITKELMDIVNGAESLK